MAQGKKKKEMKTRDMLIKEKPTTKMKKNGGKISPLLPVTHVFVEGIFTCITI